MSKSNILSFALVLAPMVVALHCPLANAGDGTIERAEHPVVGQYIVVLKDPVNDQEGQSETSVQALSLQAARNLINHYEPQIRSIFQSTVINGFTVEVSEAAAVEIAQHPSVDFVEENGIVNLAATQTKAPWGLDRIDQSGLPLNKSYRYQKSGSGVHAYVFDTGIRTSHQEFGGRARSAYDVFGGAGDDKHGHGTHVAATIGGKTVGVAKKVNLHSVKILDGFGRGTTEGIVRAIAWVSKNRQNPAVVNMSIGGSASPSIDKAIRKSIATGITYVVAAGNDNTDARKTSPAHVVEAITVGASTAYDTRAAFSNFGPYVDLFAPGENIYSASHLSDREYQSLSGTSMASPHAAGVAALILQASPLLSPADVQKTIISTSIPNVIVGAGQGSPTRLLNTGVAHAILD